MKIKFFAIKNRYFTAEYRKARTFREKLIDKRKLSWYNEGTSNRSRIYDFDELHKNDQCAILETALLQLLQMEIICICVVG